jgi:hypothetical protein
MRPIVEVINEVIRPGGAECLPCDRVNLDYARHGEYLDSEEHRATELFEHPPPDSQSIPIKEVGSSIPSILCFFLDGSRRTYKIADLLIRGRYLPLIAGQVGVAVVLRDLGENQVKPVRELCSFRNVLAFPKQVTTQEDLQLLSERISEETARAFDLIHYEVKEDRDPVDLGIAAIMSHMASLELTAMQRMSELHLLHSSSLLVKDGPLRYKYLKGRGFDVTQFRNVIGVSKTFRPSFTVGTGRGKRDVGAITASLEMGQRTPVFKTLGEDRFIGVWYLRIRRRDQMGNPLQGIIKVECYAIDDLEAENGLDGERVNTISTHLLRERNVTPYGRDSRWASHIYPVFAAETFVKASLLSDTCFEAFF